MAVAAAAALAMVLLLGLADVAALLVARARAQTAADAAALAAAADLLPGSAGDPRGEAERFARANGGRLASCAWRWGGEVTVTVEVPVRLAVLRPVAEGRVRARARAEVDLARLGKPREAGSILRPGR